MSGNTMRSKLESFGFIFTKEIPVGGCFLFPDGTFLDFEKNIEKGVIKRATFGGGIHGSVSDFIRYNIEDCVPNWQYERDNNRSSEFSDILVKRYQCIKLQDAMMIKFEHPYISLPKEEITSEEYLSLLNWMYYLYKKNKTYVYVYVNNCTPRHQVDLLTPENNNGHTPEDIIKLIKKTYNIASQHGWDVAAESIKQF